ncbi:hypothetical protein [Aminobacter sp. SR38]|uniref:GFA family protein n=1 Tax=Aminobacter sp. SR38 TaxID=2774562 RepID=UPI001FEEBF8F|nr:hypothetical protein [Aminobacter sp. SR38]
MTSARCACGALGLILHERPQLIALCHCFACQRRTGAPFSAGSFAEPSFPPPAMSVFEQAKHSWVRLDETVESFHSLPGGQS